MILFLALLAFSSTLAISANESFYQKFTYPIAPAHTSNRFTYLNLMGTLYQGNDQGIHTDCRNFGPDSIITSSSKLLLWKNGKYDSYKITRCSYDSILFEFNKKYHGAVIFDEITNNAHIEILVTPRPIPFYWYWKLFKSGVEPCD
jgi:hypothetical protein